MNMEAKLDSAIRKIDLLAHDVKFLLQIVQRNAICEDVETPENLNLPINQECELKEFDRKLEDEDFFRNMFVFGKIRFAEMPQKPKLPV
ncbi:uncharacterized protein isoform X2 [Leptinotarsa decemlineata]|uniref:uncharacterized protein isoform X2 n=1 Tax=Leptinotarsa decemlineata TaxID=7539 RepID=UPI003D309330